MRPSAHAPPPRKPRRLNASRLRRGGSTRRTASPPDRSARPPLFPSLSLFTSPLLGPDPWWVVHVVNLTEGEYRQLDPAGGQQQGSAAASWAAQAGPPAAAFRGTLLSHKLGGTPPHPTGEEMHLPFAFKRSADRALWRSIERSNTHAPCCACPPLQRPRCATSRRGPAARGEGACGGAPAAGPVLLCASLGPLGCSMRPPSMPVFHQCLPLPPTRPCTPPPRSFCDLNGAAARQLYARGLVWLEVPVRPEDHLSIPPLEVCCGLCGFPVAAASCCLLCRQGTPCVTPLPLTGSRVLQRLPPAQ